MNEKTLLERIEINPEVLVGKPVIRGTRLSVELILSLLEGGWSFDDIIQSYPGIAEEDIRACIAYAREVIEDVKDYSLRG